MNDGVDEKVIEKVHSVL